MEYQVYLDVLFFWNLMLDCLILHQTGLLLGGSGEKGKRRLLRTAAAGVLGAAGSCLAALCYALPFFLKIVLTLPGLSCLMVWVGFSRAKKRAGRRLFVRQYLTFLSDALLLGGCVVFLQYRCSLRTFPAVLLAGGLTEAGICLYRLLKKRQDLLYDVCLYYGGKEFYVKGFYDTGNHLICPWNQKAVHILDEACLRGEASHGASRIESQIESQIKSRIESQIKSRIESQIEGSETDRQKEELTEGFFYIPFSSVGKEGGIIKATQAEALKVFREEGEFLIERPIVALGASSLFSGRPYQMILHSSIADIKSSGRGKQEKRGENKNVYKSCGKK